MTAATLLTFKDKKATTLTCFFIVLLLFLSSSSIHTTFQNYGKTSGKIDEHILQMSRDDVSTVVIQLRDDYEAYMKQNLRFKAGMGESRSRVISFLNERGAVIINTFWLGNYILANVTAEQLYELSTMEGVKKIFLNFEVTILDAYENSEVVQIEGSNVTWGLDRIGAPKAWAMGFNGSGIRVCVIDTGVEISHPDIVGKMYTNNASDPTYPGGWIEFDEYGKIVVGSRPHDTHGHGTHVSGTVVGGNSSGIAIGVAPGAKLMHALALPGGKGTFAQCLAAMQWAICPYDQYGNPAGEKADIVSMSWGSTGYIDELIEPIRKMKDVGVIPIAAIGNEGEGSSSSPGNVYYCFGIGATDNLDKVAWFSGGEEVNWPQAFQVPYIKPDFSAPGVSVYSSVPGGYKYLSGTSMATPHVAGAAALLKQVDKNFSPDTIYTFLRISSKDLGAPGKDVRYGWGIINVSYALEFAVSASGVMGYVKDSQTLKPPKWGAVINITGVSWGETKIDESGRYEVYLLPGTYTITVYAFGYIPQNASFVVVKGEWTEINFTLTPLPMGYVIGRVEDARNNPIGNATITFVETPIPTILTNSSGDFSANVPVGTYRVDAWAWGFRPSVLTVTITENETKILKFVLQTTIKVAVIGDFKGQICDLLMRNISAHERDWDVVRDIYNYNVVIINVPSDDPGEQTFLNLIKAADYYRVGLIFTNSWPATGKPYGIYLLQKYLKDPKGSYSASEGNVYYQVKISHPIFEGWNKEDRIYIINSSARLFGWFYDYTGVTIADVGADYIGTIGGGVAYKIREKGNKHVLLAGLSQCTDTNIRNGWTEEAEKIFINAVWWASKPENFNPHLVIEPNLAFSGSYVRISGSGFAPKEKLKINLNGSFVQEILSDLNGGFETFLKLPIDSNRLFVVEAVDAYGNSASETVRVVGDTSPFSLNAGWNLVGISSNVPVKLEDLKIYYEGAWFNWTDACASKIVLGYVYWWNGSSYVIVESLEPGKGYWMYAYKPCEIYLPTSKIEG